MVWWHNACERLPARVLFCLHAPVWIVVMRVCASQACAVHARVGWCKVLGCHSRQTPQSEARVYRTDGARVTIAGAGQHTGRRWQDGAAVHAAIGAHLQGQKVTRSTATRPLALVVSGLNCHLTSAGGGYLWCPSAALAATFTMRFLSTDA